MDGAGARKSQASGATAIPGCDLWSPTTATPVGSSPFTTATTDRGGGSGGPPAGDFGLARADTASFVPAGGIRHAGGPGRIDTDFFRTNDSFSVFPSAVFSRSPVAYTYVRFASATFLAAATAVSSSAPARRIRASSAVAALYGTSARVMSASAFSMSAFARVMSASARFTADSYSRGSMVYRSVPAAMPSPSSNLTSVRIPFARARICTVSTDSRYPLNSWYNCTGYVTGRATVTAGGGMAGTRRRQAPPPEGEAIGWEPAAV